MASNRVHLEERVPIYCCKGCGHSSFLPPFSDLLDMQEQGWQSCCPDRQMVETVRVPKRFAERLTFVSTESAAGKGLGQCWLWMGRKNRNGYGRVRWLGQEPVAHRVIYELALGRIGDSMVLDHRCENRNCCNPQHCEPVTVAVNTHRGRAPLFKKAYLYAKDNHGI